MGFRQISRYGCQFAENWDCTVIMWWERDSKECQGLVVRVREFYIAMQRCPYIHEMKERLLGAPIDAENKEVTQSAAGTAARPSRKPGRHHRQSELMSIFIFTQLQ
ncbi:hypothetical protein HW555_011652 [Spodoptera exigua]|uniref:Uncharacterized protein n=1 Tax=Spodoptera exigua TaxID=7107 RepID=A0A835G4Z7_SPOEX|nr:hypothetical protein HW555_011652 [Spodoptera exigua]